MLTVIDLTTHHFPNDRILLRQELINLFLQEQPGTGKGDLASRYRYVIKIIGNNEIYWSRPANLNNGFDFTLNVSNINFNIGGKRSSTRPKHEHVLDDLRLKKQTNLPLYNKFIKEIEKIYICQPPINVNFNFGVGYNSEIILECIKWLFAEQDVTYWYYSGRAMLYERILAI